MSRTLSKIDGRLEVTQFWGGDERGCCVQLTEHDSGVFLQFTREAAAELTKILVHWLAERAAAADKPLQ